jgi:hypothetical protein
VSGGALYLKPGDGGVLVACTDTATYTLTLVESSNTMLLLQEGAARGPAAGSDGGGGADGGDAASLAAYKVRGSVGGHLEVRRGGTTAGCRPSGRGLGDGVPHELRGRPARGAALCTCGWLHASTCAPPPPPPRRPAPPCAARSCRSQALRCTRCDGCWRAARTTAGRRAARVGRRTQHGEGRWRGRMGWAHPRRLQLSLELG